MSTKVRKQLDLFYSLMHRRGNDFSVGGAKIERLVRWEAKTGEKQSRQSNSKYNFMRYVFFEKGIHSVQWGLGQTPEASWRTFENFCVKSNLTVSKVTFNCKLQKKIGEQDVQVAPPIILLGSNCCSPAPPVPAPMH